MYVGLSHKKIQVLCKYQFYVVFLFFFLCAQQCRSMSQRTRLYWMINRECVGKINSLLGLVFSDLTLEGVVSLTCWKPWVEYVHERWERRLNMQITRSESGSVRKSEKERKSAKVIP